MAVIKWTKADVIKAFKEALTGEIEQPTMPDLSKQVEEMLKRNKEVKP